MSHDPQSLHSQNNHSITVSGDGYSVRRPEAFSPVPCPCGMSTRIVTEHDQLGVSFHVTEIRHATRHYHQRTSEVYYILEGSGVIELNHETFKVSPGCVITIAAGVRHALTAEDVIKTIVVACPAFDSSDEYLD